MSRMTKLLMLLCLLVVGRCAFAQNAGTVTYVYTDPQGTPLAEADASGNITATFDYTPYGTSALGTPPNGPGYTGHVNDPETNLIYMQARYYDPATGRFLSTDPVPPKAATAFNFNRYVYGNDNPIVNVDPTGKSSSNGVDSSCNAGYNCHTTGIMATVRTFVPTTADDQNQRVFVKEVAPDAVPLGGNESITTIAQRVYHETNGMKDSKNQNESLSEAQDKITHVRLNGTKKWGSNVQRYASFASPSSGPGFDKVLRTVQGAVGEELNGVDPTDGAVGYNMRTPAQTTGNKPFWGQSVHTLSGPYISPTPVTYIVTYGK